MDDELFDIANEENKVIGQAPRKEADQKPKLNSDS